MDQAMPARTLLRETCAKVIGLTTSEVVNVKVRKTEFTIHRDVLLRSSELLRDRMASSAVKQTVFDDVSDYHFGLYVNWLYTGLVYTKMSEDDGESDDEYEDLIRGYIMGIQMRDPTYRNAIITAMFERADDVESEMLPTNSDVRVAYTATSPINAKDLLPLQHALVEIVVREQNSKKVNMMIKCKSLDEDFVRDVVQRLLDVRKMPELSVCSFHQHADGKHCNVEEPTRKRRRQY